MQEVEECVKVIEVSIVMPCLNEMETLEICIENARDALVEIERRYGLEGEILVSDNGSTDGSQELAERLGARVCDAEIQGYGSALQCGLEQARGKFLIFGDSDGSYNFLDAAPMVGKLIEGADLCMGSRFSGNIEAGAMPWLNKYFGNPFLTGVLNLFYSSGMTDAHCGLRALTASAFKKISPSSTGMEFASEIVVKAALLKLNTTEVPITLHRDKRDRAPHLRPFRDGWRHLKFLLILAPKWVFLAPSIFFLLIGLSIWGALASGPSGAMVQFGSISIGDHWSVVAALGVTLAHVCFCFCVVSEFFAWRQGYRRDCSWLSQVTKLLTFDRMALFSLFLVVAGGVFAVTLFVDWAITGVPGETHIREAVAGAMLIELGVQNLFFALVLDGIRSQQDTISG